MSFISNEEDSMLVMTSQFLCPGKTVFEDSEGEKMFDSENTELFLVRIPEGEDIDSLAYTFSRAIGPISSIRIATLENGGVCAFIRFVFWRDTLFTRILWSELVISSELNKYKPPCCRTCCQLYYQDYPAFYKLLISTGYSSVTIVEVREF